MSAYKGQRRVLEAARRLEADGVRTGCRELPGPVVAVAGGRETTLPAGTVFTVHGGGELWGYGPATHVSVWGTGRQYAVPDCPVRQGWRK